MLIPFTSASFTNLSGLAVADGAAVEVRLELNGALAALFDDRDGTTPLTNPFNADSQGRFEFYVAGRIDGYSIQVTKGAQTHTLRHQLTGSAAATIFDNTGTGLLAESVQDAIVEIIVGRRALDIFHFIPSALHSSIEAGTNSTDLSVYLQDAIDEAIDSKRRLDLLGYGLSIENQIVVRKVAGLEIAGQGGMGDTFKCALIWNGANGGNPLLLDQVRDSILGNFAITAGAGTIGVALDVDAVGAITVVPTNNTFRKMHIGASTTAVRISQSATANNDLHKFDDVVISGAGTNGYLINHSQAKFIRLLGGSISSRTRSISVIAGSFHSFGTNFSGNTTDVYLESPTDAIFIAAAQSEGAEKFLDDNGIQGTSWPVTIQGSRLDPNAVGVDDISMRFRKGGPIVLMANDFASGVHNADVRWYFHSASPGTSVISLGNAYPNITPFTTGLTQNLLTVGDRGLDSGGNAAAVAMQIPVVNDLKINKPLIVSSAAEVDGPLGTSFQMTVRDATNTGTAFVIYDNGATPNIVSQVGTSFVTGAPAATEIQIKNRTASGGIAFLAGSSRNGVLLHVSTILTDVD